MSALGLILAKTLLGLVVSSSAAALGSAALATAAAAAVLGLVVSGVAAILAASSRA